jgi:hypothetical protein
VAQAAPFMVRASGGKNGGSGKPPHGRGRWRPRWVPMHAHTVGEAMPSGRGRRAPQR